MFAGLDYSSKICMELISCSPTQGVSVEAVDPVFQAKMLDMLKQTGRSDLNSNTYLQLQYSLIIYNKCLWYTTKNSKLLQPDL